MYLDAYGSENIFKQKTNKYKHYNTQNQTSKKRKKNMNMITWQNSSLFKEREVDEVLWKVDNSVQLEVVLGSKQWQRVSRVQVGVKGHREDVVADVPTPVLSPLISLSQSASVGKATDTE